MKKAFNDNSLFHIPPESIPKLKDVNIPRLMSEGDLNKEIMRFYNLIS